MSSDRITRRRFLGTLSASALTGLSGCTAAESMLGLGQYSRSKYTIQANSEYLESVDFVEESDVMGAHYHEFKITVADTFDKESVLFQLWKDGEDVAWSLAKSLPSVVEPHPRTVVDETPGEYTVELYAVDFEEMYADNLENSQSMTTDRDPDAEASFTISRTEES